ncbi:MAG: UDP-N-acetylmuramoyl-tripeptide--D-alanyl-D-alanine ligase, partial [Nitrospinae bacterium]|nr:UDP-N-acetylmuramoyl-tripeptide--D-alanyl-D-alanine ligase [Nitrospinota bacterium]
MSEPLALAALAKACDGRLVPGRASAVRGIATDSREPMKGRLFVAIIGENFDGHRYVAEAFANGAAAALVSDPSLLLAHPTESFVLVDDTVRGLQEMARWRRGRVKGLTVVAVTGSNGKTTVKEMIGAILRAKGKTLVTRGNLNNHVGLPKTLMGLAGDERYAVIEMGMSHAGEIERLCQIARPDIGVITNVGAAHLGHFKNVAAVAAAKGEMIGGLGAKGIALLNAADKGSAPLVARHGARPRTFTFGRSPDARWSLVDSWPAPGKPGRQLAVMEGAKETVLTVPLLGAHQADNACAAFAVGRL